MIASFEEMLRQVTGHVKRTIAVAMAEDEDILEALCLAHSRDIADAVLVGNKTSILEIAGKGGLDLSSFDIIHAES